MKTPPLIPAWLLLATGAVILLALYATAHASIFDYDWHQTRPASVKPWLYVVVQDVDQTCREAGADATGLARINGCATWKPVQCVIYLPPNAPRWIIEHEERHCAGFTH